ncbi:XVIPCD domain-containing protein [Dyella koreensis]|uniref:X-Tfes XVIPCD domain-containing protein n=1 Tax=Dyella koreensis TaxID=311235 RepID=A0ABW8K6G7_9GAMM
MAKPNPHLEAAFAQFATQPGIGPEQVAQLREAVTADAALLDTLNRQATKDQLTGFAVESGDGLRHLTGSYDLSSRLVILPSSSLSPFGTGASGDLKSIVKLQSMMVHFANSSYGDTDGDLLPVSQGMLDNLQSTINGSPALSDEIKRSVSEGHLKQLNILDAKSGAGGTYDPGHQSMNLPALSLQTKAEDNPQGRFDARDLTFVMGHEIQHSFNSAAKQQSITAFMKAIEATAAEKSSVHDYTRPIANLIQASREDEAKAEIAGWNALLSHQKQALPTAGLDEMLDTQNNRTADFVQQDPSSTRTKAEPRPGLNFNQDGTLSPTPANIAAMGHHYFDRPDPKHAQPGQRPLVVGRSGEANYPNYYGRWAIERVIEAEDKARPFQGHKPELTIDMQRLGLSEELLEKEGIDLGKDKTPRPYFDSSQLPSAPHHFDHTRDGPNANQYVPVVSHDHHTPSTRHRALDRQRHQEVGNIPVLPSLFDTPETISPRSLTPVHREMHPDSAHEHALLREVEMINQRTEQELGRRPPGHHAPTLSHQQTQQRTLHDPALTKETRVEPAHLDRPTAHMEGIHRAVAATRPSPALSAEPAPPNPPTPREPIPEQAPASMNSELREPALAAPVAHLRSTPHAVTTPNADAHELDPRHPEHPDHGTYRSIQEQLTKLHDARGFRLDPDQMERLATGTLIEAKRAGLREVTHMEFGQNRETGQVSPNIHLFQAFRGDIDDPRTGWGAVDAQQAMHVPLVQSHQQLQTVNQQMDHQQQLNEQLRMQTQQQSMGPKMTM